MKLYSAGLNKFLPHSFIGIILEVMCQFFRKGRVVWVIDPRLGLVTGRVLHYSRRNA